MKNPNYDLVLEEYIGSTKTHRRAIVKRYPKFAADLNADTAVIEQMEAIATASEVSKTELQAVLNQLNNQKQQSEKITNDSSHNWSRFQPWSLAFGGVAVFVMVFGSVLVLQMRPTTDQTTPATVVANGTITNTVSQINANTQAEQAQATLDEQPTSLLDNQINLASKYHTSLGDIYNAVAQ